ncbi:uncharacterized protein ARB_02575 [Trichophyton benhamiae CBS 112371]|uniref:Methyltransferase domain-containing protein n=1 Tax=Arthroderma benhamiae (strain ATCC MYA-4681 / CBS 112371) TaxID=663331 RepID=D4B292_ARTBC|nr:uncharacterized protein ARB_02575 [Trichophyton benhamiae CBS 112371]EFE30653.1 hypothetical protein ARB_02575 [Trichophyton benhamiae CBS 112371]
MSIQPDIYTTPAPAATMAQEGSSYYDSPYMVEFYNLKWGKPSMPDMGIYWKIFTDAVTQHREAAPDKPFSVLDVGTGAGRVPIGNALALDELPTLLPLSDKHITIDLLVFAFNSVCHMERDGELAQFFLQYHTTMNRMDCQGKLCVCGEDVQVFQQLDDGRDKEIEVHRVRHSLRWFTKPEFSTAIEAAGLRIVEVSKVDESEETAGYDDNVYILQRA